MFKKALQRVKNIASQAQQSPTDGYSGPIPQSRAMTDSETAAHNAAFDKMRADVAALPKMTGFFGNAQPVKAQQSQQSPVSSGSMMGAFQPVVRAPGQPVQVQNTSGTPAGLGAMGVSGKSMMSAFGQPIARVGSNPMPPGGGLPAVPQGMKKGGKVKVSSASKRADGIATKGKTRGRMV